MKVWCKKISKINKGLDAEKVVIGLLVLTTLLSGGILASTRVKADDSATTVVDEISVMIPVACSMAGTPSNDNTYTRTVTASSYTSDIGSTNLKVFCNDFAGFSVYAVGFTNDTVGNNIMTTNTTPAQTINTGTATSGNTSNWAMKLTKVTNTSGQQDITYGEDNLSITDGTTNYNGVYRTVPGSYTKVATYTNNNGPATTDTTLGSNIEARYAVYVAGNQMAGTYEGKVKYMLVHPVNLALQTYTVVYNANGGRGSAMANDTNILTIEPHTLKANTYTALNGYTFAGWCTVLEKVSQGDYQTTCNGTSYPNNGTIPAGAVNGGKTLNLYAYWEKTSTQGYIMQEVDEWGDELYEGDEVTATDSRDGKAYTVAKLADGNIWMTQDLDHDIGDINGGVYTPEDTDIPDDWVLDENYAYTIYGSDYGVDFDEYQESWWCSDVKEDCRFEPQSFDLGDDWCWNGDDYGGYSKIENCDEDSNTHYRLGNLYNWTAAVAMDDSSDYTEEDDIDQSICPAGWRLPLGGNDESRDKSFAKLLSKYGGYHKGFFYSPVYFNVNYVDEWLLYEYSTEFSADGAVDPSYGEYWTSTLFDSDYAGAVYYSTGELEPEKYIIILDGEPRIYVASIRCVAK